jgi:hypothetical protein
MSKKHWKISLGVCLALLLAFFGSVALAQDNIKIYVDGKQVVSDVQPRIIDGRTMVPIRFVAEALGAKVEWDGISKKVSIATVKPPQPQPQPQPQVPQYKYMKYNGNQTSWIYWEADGKLYVEVYGALAMAKIKNPTRQISLIYSSDIMIANNNNFDLPVKMFDNFKAVPLEFISMKGLLEYQWDSATGNIKF